MNWMQTHFFSNFGLVRFVDDCPRSHTTGVAGTMGYMDTECMLAGRANVESHVYIFGVVLLTIARDCLRPTTPDSEGGSILDAADARLDGELDAREMAYT
ncbi:hypothetical protein EJB05_50170, partial [Eragrostis curvula]